MTTPTLSLNEQISTMLGPQPDYTPQITGHLGGGNVMLDRASITPFWKCNLREYQWVPIEWDTDEAACARLLDAMPQPMVFRSNANGNWKCRPDYGIAEYAPESHDRKTAICLAFVAYFSQLSNEEKQRVRSELSK